MLSAGTVGEPIEQAHREGEYDRVMLSAPHTEGFHRERGGNSFDEVRAKHLRRDRPLWLGKMLRGTWQELT